MMIVDSNTKYSSDRVSEIRSLNPAIFKLYLESLDEKDVKLYEFTRSTISGYSSERDLTCRENIINNMISVKSRDYSTFQIKLMELAYLFPNEEQWTRFTIGDIAKGEKPLSDEQIAYAYDTSVANVQMKKSLDEAISVLHKEERVKTYDKEMD